MSLLLLLSAALAQQNNSLLFQIHDPEGLLQGSPIVTMVDAAGNIQNNEPRDDGIRPDVVADDGLYVHPVMNLTGVDIQIHVSDGQQEWEGNTEINVDTTTPMLVARLTQDGTMRFSDWPPPTKSADGSTRPELTSEETGQLNRGYWLWAIFIGIGGGTLGIGLLSLRKAASAPAKLSVTHPSIPTTLVSHEDLEATVESLIKTHRVVVLGKPLDGTIGCTEPQVHPAELFAATVELALSPGRSPALVITDTARLVPSGSTPPVMELEELVAGRIPMVVCR